MTDQPPAIYPAMATILTKIPAIAKDARNIQSGYGARSIDQVMDVMHGLFAEVGVVPVPEVLEKEYIERESVSDRGKKSTIIDARITVAYRFTAVDGSYVTSVVATEGRDYADKATTKALSQAFKYAMLQTFSIPLNDHDPDTESIEVTRERGQPVPLREQVRMSSHPDWVIQAHLLEQLDGDKEAASTLWDSLRRDVGLDPQEPIDVAKALVILDEYEANA